MSNMPRPLKVFLCHAHADKSAVRHLYRHLKERKIDAWLDAENLLPGQNWQVEIPKALNSSDAIIVCLSKNSVDKEGYVQTEIKFALDKALEMPEGRIFLIPARLEECDLPHSLSAFHFVNLFEEDGHRRLLRSLRARAEQIGATKIGQITNVPQHEELPEPADRVSNPTIMQDEKESQAASLIYEHTPVVKPEPKKQAGTKFPLWGIGLTAFAILALTVWGLSSIPIPPTATQTPFATQTVFIETATSTVTITPTPTLGPGSTMTGEKGETLVYVPEGEFTMGSDKGESDEQPIHQVYLDAFWIDQTEVTNKQYQACVNAGTCEPPSNTDHFNKSDYANHPVVYVNWDKANRYCEVWAGGDLPTEAQWEKAARGTDGRTYPWSEDISCDKANYQSSCVGDTSPVGSYESGKSPYEVYDMAGNVWEWVNDWYQSNYYATLGDNASNPQGPSTGDSRVLRGGSWDNYDLLARSANRDRDTPVITNYNIGFRCARSLP